MDNHYYYLLCAAIAPVIAGLGYIFAKDRYNKEPLGMLVRAFFCGVISIFPICIIEGILSLFLDQSSVFFNSFWNAFIVAACTEECFKLYFLRKLIWNSPEFDERFDGIVYGVFVSLGFACAENISYVLGALVEGGEFTAYYISFGRAIFTIPCHFFCGVILGYYLSIAKFEVANQNDDAATGRVIFKGLFYAIVFHGIFDFILMYQENYAQSIGKDLENSPGASTVIWSLFAAFLVFNILFWKYGRKRINHLAGLLRPNSSDELPAFIKCSNCGKTYASNINVCPKCNQSTEKTILAIKDSNNDFENQNLHNLNKYSSNHKIERSNKNPYDIS